MTRPKLDFCNRLGMTVIALLGVLSALVAATPAHAGSDLAVSLVKQVETLVVAGRQGPLAESSVENLYRAAVKQHGNVKPLLTWLAKARGDGRDARSQALVECEAHIAARCGDLKHANRALTALLAIEGLAASRPDLRLWQARLLDALGEIDKARDAYKALMAAGLSQADQQMVRLRLALMGLLGQDGSEAADNAKELIDLAKTSDDTAFRNRAATVLAVQNQYAEAIKLFVVEGVGTARFRNASRMAEWAIRANNRQVAVASAWDAVRSAQIKRDRRYALTLLVEAYRMGKAREGLVELVTAFAAEESKKDAPPCEEMRTVWVDLLRELGRHDDAIELFKTSAAEGGFSVELRRELLEMEGEAGNIEKMIASYRVAITAEPDQFVWRGGLTRVLLEQGDSDGAAELWGEYLGRQTSGPRLLQAAETLGDLGLDELAARAAERMIALKVNHAQALLYLADLHRRRGRLAQSEATLDRLHALSDAGDAARAELAGAYERVGRQDKAVKVMEQIRANRADVAEDLEMRLAWLYSEIGDEDKALEQWLALWRKVTSVARRRYAEDRIMTVASRLGTLADIAIDLEEKLRDGKADDREAGLLVRIYSRVNDSVAATEILETYMAQTGSSEVARLKEKGRIYQICNDYWNYEKVIERLIEVDPDGRTDHLRHLALSMLERGKPQEARSVLLKLRDSDAGADSIDSEFEAGILAMVGLTKEAADAYRGALAQHPDRIECYLLLANLLKAIGETESAVGMFQFLAETADRDDLFTIAIDGLLNMQADRRVMQWARRITLERLARREDKNYLYQLLADLSAEVNDRNGQVRALENSLAVSGSRRLSVLRECMDLSSRLRGGAFYRSGSRSAGNAGNKPFFAFGRRLIGLGELMPPQVFIDLGQAFLNDGDLVSAKRTFDLARNVADERGYQRQVARIFELSAHRGEALARYDRLLRTSPSDVALIVRVAKLNEQEGRDAIAARFYLRGHNLLMAQSHLTTQDAAAKSGTYVRYRRGNIDAYRTYTALILRGLLVTIPDDAVDGMLAQQKASLAESVQELKAQGERGRVAEKLVDAPRIERQSEALRRLYFAFDRIKDVEAMDLTLLRQFKADTDLPVQMVSKRIAHGQYSSAKRLAGSTEVNGEQRRRIAVILGQSVEDDDVARPLPPRDMWRGLIPALVTRDVDAARRLLRRVDATKARSEGYNAWRTVYVNGVYTRVPSAPGDLATWMRLAVVLGDDVQALNFARRRVQQHRTSGRMLRQLVDRIKSCRSVLPDEAFRSLVRYSASLFRADEQRTAEYIWLVSQFGDVLGEARPTDKQLLALVEQRKLRLSYYLSATQVLDMLPESIRAKGLSAIIADTDVKMQLRFLATAPNQYTKPLGKDVGQVIGDGVASALKSGLKPNEMMQRLYSLIPRQIPWLSCVDNADAALKVLDAFVNEARGDTYKDVLIMARMMKAVVLWEADRGEEALKMARETYKTPPETKMIYVSNLRSAMQRIISQDKVKPAQQTTQRGANPGCTMKEIADTQRRLVIARKSADDKIKATVDDIERRLGDMWISRGHAVNGLPLWLAADDRDRAEFGRQKAERTGKQAGGGSASPSTQPASSQPAAAARPPAVSAAGVHRVVSGSSKAISELRTALEAGDKQAARRMLRDIWRAFPPVDMNPYGRIYGRSNLNSLQWPHQTAAEDARIDDKNRQATRAEQRRQLRGGLATLKPVEKSPTTAGQSQSLWQALAGEPLAVVEMQRLLRSRQVQEVRVLDEVVLGLLRADRMAKGDEAVFAELLNDVRQGRAGHVELVKLFAMTREDPSRLNADNQDVLADLMRQLDEDQLQMLSQLASLCGSAGQKDRSSALYTYCSLRGHSFSSLISGAGKVFDGDKLVALVERMYAVAPRSNTLYDELMLDLRLEHLPADEAIKRSVELFKDLDSDAESIPLSLAVRGVQLFAQTGQLQKARTCLRVILSRGAKSHYHPFTLYRRRPPKDLVTRSDILRIFPEKGSAYGDYAGWLAVASGQIAKLLDSKDIDKTLATECQAIIALRQWQCGAADAANVTLASIYDLLSEDGRPHAELAVDVMRQAGLFERALQLQAALYKNDQLSHVRLGDLLSDTARVRGRTSALELMEKLLKESLDDDLLKAARGLLPDDSQHRDRISDLHRRNLAALAEYDRRSLDRRLRDQTRAKWREEDNRKQKP